MKRNNRTHLRKVIENAVLRPGENLSNSVQRARGAARKNDGVLARRRVEVSQNALAHVLNLRSIPTPSHTRCSVFKLEGLRLCALP